MNLTDKEILVGYGIDIDAVAGWLGSYGGEESPNDIQRGLFAGEVGIPRLLKLLRGQNILASWFIPGHSIETFPTEVGAIADAGHEIGAHGYSHENPVAMSPKQEEDVLEKSIDLIRKTSGKDPVGYVAPWWEMSRSTINLLLDRNFKYDHSEGHHDFQPYYARTGESWTKINYRRPAKSWMKPLIKGHSVDLVEIPANWYLDDLPPMMFIKNLANSHGWVSPRVIEEMWRDQFDWIYREFDYGIFPMTIHPDVSGRPQVLLMHERFIEYINNHKGVRWCTFEEMAGDFRKRRPFSGKQ